jgi:ATP-dependent protease Clp ATPase subunit
MLDAHGTQASRLLHHCSFCAKVETDVRVLIAGVDVFICDECVQVCQEIIAQRAGTPTVGETPNPVSPDKMPTENLLKILVGYNGAFKKTNAAMQDIVDILRARDVTWATVGQTLAVSRQAAWKRFAGNGALQR